MALALALKARGHRVSFVGPEQHGPYVRPAGLDFTGLPADEAVLRDPDLWHPTRGFGVVWRATRPAMDRIAPFVAALPHDGPCVLLVHPLALPEADLCRAARPDIRIAAAYLAPQNLPTAYGPFMAGPYTLPDWVPPAARRWLWRVAGRTVIDPVALPDVNAARVAAGLAPFPTLVPDMLAVPDLSVTLFPAWFAPTQPDWPQPLVRAGFPLYDPNPDAPLAPELERFLADGTAPLVFTHGTGNAQAAAFFRHARTAVASLAASTGQPVRAVFLTAHRAQLGDALPPAILWQDYVPLRRLLRHAALLVHHGGIGTTAEALHAGIPQLVVPLAHDQFDNGARVAALGVGARLPAARLGDPRRAVRLTRALAGLLGDEATARRCAAVRQRFGGDPTPADLCVRLEALAGGG